MKIKIFLLISFIILITICANAIEPVAYPLKINGKVDLTRDLESTELKVGDNLFNKDEVETKSESFAAIQFADKSSIIKLFPNSILHIQTEQKGKKMIKKSLLRMGELWAKIEKGSGKFEIETPTTVASVKGTAFLMKVTEDGKTEIATIEGKVLFLNKSTGVAQTVSAGERGTITADEQIIIEPYDPTNIEPALQGIIDDEYQIIEEEKATRVNNEEHPDETQDMIEEDDKSESSPSSSTRPFNMGGSVGAVMLGDETYTQIRLMPELTFGKFGIGLDIDLMIDSNGNIRKEDWDDFEDYVNKIYYLRYAQRGDPFYGRLGGFKTFTLGHGLVMKNYSNMLRYPEYKQIGIQLGGNLPIAGMTGELFTSNVVKNEILGGRLTFKPLNNTSIPLFNNLVFGGTIAHDRNQVKGLLDSDEDNYPDHFDDYPFDDDWHNEVDHDINEYRSIYLELNPTHSESQFLDWFQTSPSLNELRNPSFSDFEKDDVTVFGVDYELPFIQNPILTLSHYAEAAKIVDHKMGFIFPGFYSKFLIFHMNLEYRFYQDDFLPAFFDQLYDEQRAVVYADVDSVITKESLLQYTAKSHGWYGEITTNLLNLIYVTIAYEDMYDENENNFRSLWGKANLNLNFTPKLTKAEIAYTQTGFDKLTEFKTANAIIKGTLGYSLGGSTQLVGHYQEHYVDLNYDGKIKGKDETIKTMSMGVEFVF